MDHSSLVRVASLGLFILDTFEWRNSAGQVLRDREAVTQVGGGGTYAILGARMWLAPSEIGLLVERGNDWSDDVQTKLDEFGTGMWYYRDKKDRPTTRALNLYTGEHREFQYLTPRTPITPSDLPSPLLHSHAFHLVCSPSRLLAISSQLCSLLPVSSYTLIYEPLPSSCVASSWDELKIVLALPALRVFSPNHEEAAGFFGIDGEGAEFKARGKKGIEDVARRFRNETGAKCEIVIRSGAMGAFVLPASGGSEGGIWSEAYFEEHEAKEKVNDVTGAGNAFLGGVMAGLELEPNDLIGAVEMGSVSASYVIEQFGLPHLSVIRGVGEEAGLEVELWNGDRPQDRLRKLRKRRGGV